MIISRLNGGEKLVDIARSLDIEPADIIDGMEKYWPEYNNVNLKYVIPERKAIEKAVEQTY